MSYPVIRPYDPSPTVEAPHPDWWIAFSAAILATLVVTCMILYQMDRKPVATERVMSQQERNARTMIDLYGEDWYGKGCGQRRCR